VAERVVDLLEAVEVDQEHGDVLVDAPPAQCDREVLVQRDAVRQPGQRVVRGLVADLGDVRAHPP
jgi:hypothetical protein